MQTTKALQQKCGVILVLVVFLMAADALPTRAQTTQSPELLLTWRAQAYAPSSFQGKILPSGGSTVGASLEVILNNKLVDLSRETIYWYLNDQFLKGGVGVQSVSFVVPQGAAGTHSLRVQMNNFQNKGGIVLTTASIPGTKPEVVIEAPFSGNKFSGSAVSVYGQPYFFNVEDPSKLTFSWKVNGQAPASVDNPQTLDIGLPSITPGTTLNINLNVSNPKNIFESVSRLLTLTAK